MVDEGSLNEVLGQIEQAREEGAVVLEGGHRAGNGGYFLEPTLLAQVDGSMTIAREETAGPPVLEEPRIRVARGDAAEEARLHRGQRPAPAAMAEETIQGGLPSQPGRTIRVRTRERP